VAELCLTTAECPNRSGCEVPPLRSLYVVGDFSNIRWPVSVQIESRTLSVPVSTVSWEPNWEPAGDLRSRPRPPCVHLSCPVHRPLRDAK
jgi:hypothetical protein